MFEIAEYAEFLMNSAFSFLCCRVNIVMRNIGDLFRKTCVCTCIFLSLLSPIIVVSQTTASVPSAIVSFQQTQEQLCTSQPLAEKRTYSFRELPRAPQTDGAYGRKHWYSSIKKLVPFWGGSLIEKYGIDDIRTMRNTYGADVPLGESVRSQRIRIDSESKLKLQQDLAEQNWQKWLAENPKATVDERNRAEIRIRIKGLDSKLMPKFDWREHGLDVGEVGFQGFRLCNTCWAFTTVDAMQISRRLMAIRSGKDGLNESLKPSARQLISNMVPEANYCAFNWHGKAFTFMVDKGLPLGGSTKYIDQKIGWVQDATQFVRALTWDYVSSSPQNVAPTDEIKRAIILYGSVVSILKFDNCLNLYGGGVFNETQNSLGAHLVLIIGWDDEKGAWLIKNSYSKDWGEGGFGWIKYGSNNIGQFAAWVAADPDEETRLSEKMRTAQ